MASLTTSAPLAAIGEHVELFTTLDSPATILLVDGVELNRRVLKATLQGLGANFIEARRPSEAFEILEETRVDLILCDMFLPEVNGLEFCRRLKSNRNTHLLPVLMLTSVQGTEHEVGGNQQWGGRVLDATGSPERSSRPGAVDVAPQGGARFVG